MSLNSNKKSSRKTKISPQFSIPSGNKPLLDLLEIQRKSFFGLLERGIPHELAKTDTFRETAKNSAFTHELELVLNPETYKFISPNCTPKQAILKGKTYACKMYVQATLTVRSSLRAQEVNLKQVKRVTSSITHSLATRTLSDGKKLKGGSGFDTAGRSTTSATKRSKKGVDSPPNHKTTPNVYPVWAKKELIRLPLQLFDFQTKDQHLGWYSINLSTVPTSFARSTSFVLRSWLFGTTCRSSKSKTLLAFRSLPVHLHHYKHYLRRWNSNSVTTFVSTVSYITKGSNTLQSKIAMTGQMVKSKKNDTETINLWIHPLFFYKMKQAQKRTTLWDLKSNKILFYIVPFTQVTKRLYSGKGIPFPKRGFTTLSDFLSFKTFKRNKNGNVMPSNHSMTPITNEVGNGSTASPLTIFDCKGLGKQANNQDGTYKISKLAYDTLKGSVMSLIKDPMITKVSNSEELGLTDINNKDVQVFHPWIFLGELPLMTKRGHFILNGSPRVIVNQIARCPGIYFQEKRRGVGFEQEVRVSADLIPQRGPWLRIQSDWEGRFWARLKQEGRIKYTTLYEAFQEFEKNYHAPLFNILVTNSVQSHRKWESSPFPKSEIAAFQERKTKEDRQKKALIRLFKNSTRYSLGKLGRFRINQRIHFHSLYESIRLQQNVESTPGILTTKNRHWGNGSTLPTSLVQLRNPFSLLSLGKLSKSLFHFDPPYKLVPMWGQKNSTENIHHNLRSKSNNITNPNSLLTLSRKWKDFGSTVVMPSQFSSFLRKWSRGVKKPVTRPKIVSQHRNYRWGLGLLNFIDKRGQLDSSPKSIEVEPPTSSIQSSKFDTEKILRIKKGFVKFGTCNNFILKQVQDQGLILSPLSLLRQEQNVNASLIPIGIEAKVPPFEPEIAELTRVIIKADKKIQVIRDKEINTKQNNFWSFPNKWNGIDQVFKAKNDENTTLEGNTSLFYYYTNKKDSDSFFSQETKLEEVTKRKISFLDLLETEKWLRFFVQNHPIHPFHIKVNQFKNTYGIYDPTMVYPVRKTTPSLQHSTKKHYPLTPPLTGSNDFFFTVDTGNSNVPESHVATKKGANFFLSHSELPSLFSSKGIAKSTTWNPSMANKLPVRSIKLTKKTAFNKKVNLKDHVINVTLQVGQIRNLHDRVIKFNPCWIPLVSSNANATSTRKLSIKPIPSQHYPHDSHYQPASHASQDQLRSSSWYSDNGKPSVHHSNKVDSYITFRPLQRFDTFDQLEKIDLKFGFQQQNNNTSKPVHFYNSMTHITNQLRMLRKTNFVGTVGITSPLTIFDCTGITKHAKLRGSINKITNFLSGPTADRDMVATPFVPSKIGIKEINKCSSMPKETEKTVLSTSFFSEEGVVAKEINTTGVRGLLMAADIDAIHTCLESLLEGRGFTDDIDHLKNRFVRTSGKLLQQQFELGLHRLNEVITPMLGNLLQNHLTFLRDSKVSSQSVVNSFALPSQRDSHYSQSEYSRPSTNEVDKRADSSNAELVHQEQRLWGEEKKSRKSRYSNNLEKNVVSKQNDGETTSTLPALDVFNEALPSERVRNTDKLKLKSNTTKKTVGKLSKKHGADKATSNVPISYESHLKSLTLRNKQVPTNVTSKNLGGIIERKGKSNLTPKGSLSALQPRNVGKIAPFRWLRTSKPINSALREFFGSNPLSQYMDQTNPLAEITHKRRLSSMGPGGIKRETAGMEVRGIHPTHYGRVCPIETPEGKNAGLVNSPTVYGRIGTHGFLETPLYQVVENQIQRKRWAFFSAQQEEEESTSLATCDIGLARFHLLANVPIPVQTANNPLAHFQQVERHRVGFRALSPVQTISIATALIPFLEHDDANRALMGSNMQRQAIPLLFPERPIVGTGFEPLVVVESGQALQATKLGCVSHVNASSIRVHSLHFVGEAPPQHVLRNTIDNNLCFDKDCQRTKLIKRKKCLPLPTASFTESPSALGEILHFLIPKKDLGFVMKELKKSSGCSISKIYRRFFDTAKERHSTLNIFLSSANKIHKLRIGSYITTTPGGNNTSSTNAESAWHVKKPLWKTPFLQKNHVLTICPIATTQSVTRPSFQSSIGQMVPIVPIEQSAGCTNEIYPVHSSFRLDNKQVSTVEVRMHRHSVQKHNDNKNQKAMLKIPAYGISIEKTTRGLTPSVVTPFPSLGNYSEKDMVNPLLLKENTFEVPLLVNEVLTCRKEVCSLDSLTTSKLRGKLVDIDISSIPSVPFQLYKPSAVPSLRSVQSFQSLIGHIKMQQHDSQYLLREYSKQFPIACCTHEVLPNQVINAEMGTHQNHQQTSSNYQATEVLSSLPSVQSKIGQKVHIVQRACGTTFGSAINKICPLQSHIRWDSKRVNNVEMGQQHCFASQVLSISKKIRQHTATRLHLCPSYSTFLLKPNQQTLQLYQRSNQETCLNQRPIVQEGDWVQKGDFLADCSASHLGDLALGKNVTVAYMPWEGYNFEDAIVISDRLVSEDIYTSLHIERYEIKISKNSQGKERITNRIPGTSHSLKHLDNFGVARISSWVQPGDILVGKVVELKRPLSPYERLAWELASRLSPASPEREKWLNKVWLEDISLRLPSGVCGRVINSQIVSTEWSNKEQVAYPLEVHIYVAVKRKIQIGDKLAGRHGNKGIVSTILPQQDMPYLGNGKSVDMVLNPLGVPSRMNLGQIFECLLGLAGSQLGCHFKVTPFDEVAGGEASRSLVFLKLYQCRLMYKQQWLFTPTFPGKSKLFDGRTGEPFENWVTVGQAYMLKLIHMVDHKIHARSTGPYSLFTRQPVRGRSRRGGQRLGEMEVWAVEGFGAAYTLQEFLTIKSDDLKARTALQRGFYKQNDVTFGKVHIAPGNPEAFKVLVSELQALCLHIQM